MQKLEIHAGLFDELTREVTASLERGREHLDQVVQAIQLQAERFSAASLAQSSEARNQAGEVTRLTERVQVATAELEAMGQSLPRSTKELLRACEELAAARADLAVALERQAVASRQAATLRAYAQALNDLSTRGGQVVSSCSGSVDALLGSVRELSARLESAQQSRALGLHVIRAQEEERRHLAREIHDGPAQLLNSVVLRIDVCQRLFDTDQQRLREELQQLKDLVRLSLQDVRKIIFDLRPMALDDLGLTPALRAFLKDFQGKTGVETDFVMYGNDRRYDSTFEVAIFRLVQEALTNVFKHAGATRVWVKVETTGGREIKLMVKDDGVGFDPDQVRQASAGTKFGLVGMRERVELLGGHMEIKSAPGQGARLDFIFPLAE